MSPPSSLGVRCEGPFTRVLAGVALHPGFGRRGLGVMVMTRTVDACGPAWFACVV